MRAFCTIITLDFLPFAKTLFQSIRKFDKDVDLIALVVDSQEIPPTLDFEILTPNHLCEFELVKRIFNTYSQKPNELRWSLKSVLMIHLLMSRKYDQVFFVDHDICFYSDFRFLYQELDGHPFLLSPTWGCTDPKISELYFSLLLTDGLFNAGFIGATESGLDTLYWWSESCLHACERDNSRGLYDDQAYLNLFPILSPKSKIIRHRGCNVAEWNRFENIRSLTSEGALMINGTYPLVFIHFSNLGYLVEHDPLLVPYLERYEIDLNRNGYKGSLLSPAKKYVNRQRLKGLSYFERLVRKAIGPKRFSKLKGWE